MIRKENGGKPSSLNAGLAAASHDLVVVVDGDTVHLRLHRMERYGSLRVPPATQGRA